MKPATRTLAPDSHVMCGQRAQDVDPDVRVVIEGEDDQRDEK